ncbi:protein tyrosine phosphatase [Metarhizium album ARSEF 1941]|uniref:alkaline phosphatase n=1 Tax=Metarhizium album (strain ARSEF 1941) TaxID=1081103 RepID=A0A0B2WNN5_METAS|nr:protein tyrosine phosphatase [Metarhizium album ARSEF 1941]KHN94615.1 protein tyrosine phosphatase [Metarhizium album ARSEF 1941]
MLAKLNVGAVLAASLSVASAQTYQRLGTCPTLGCLLPPDQSDFLPGQLFDLRVEVHAPVNGSEAAHNGIPDENFKVTIAKDGKDATDITAFFGVKEPELEKWNFSWYEDLFAEDNKTPSVVNVASKAYRKLCLNEPGKYTLTLQYYGDEKTTAEWVVRPTVKERKARNVIFFIGDGMTTNMITAARLLGHKSINGKYQTRMQMDEFPVLGHQMTHSIDSYITDSANSASALYSGHKSTVNAMGVHADSSPDPFDDPKVETIVEIFRRITKGAWGAVSTAFLADATPIALSGHTRRRSEYAPLIDQALNGVTNYSWTDHGGPDVFFGAGAEHFFAGKGSYQGRDYYEEFSKKGYSVSLNKTSLEKIDTTQRALGVFCQSSLPVWLDRNVYTDNLKKFKNDPKGGSAPALDLPGLKEMTLKAVEVLHERGGDKGFFLMSEAASIDKQMHALDYDRALGDLLELDDTVRETIKKLEGLGILNETLVVVSADHGHGFDVWGSADTEYIAKHDDERTKRNAIGVYEKSGLSQYTEKGDKIQYGTGVNFPSNWEPRYAIAGGVGAAPDRREDYKVHKSGPRVPAVKGADGSYVVNAKDSPNGIVINGTLPTSEAQGVHSLTDVPVFAMGPCQDMFGGTFNNVDMFYKMATCLGLARPNDQMKIEETANIVDACA